MPFKTLDDFDLNGMRVLVRVDLNLPVRDGVVTDITRAERIIPTLKDILAKGGKPVLLSHFGIVFVRFLGPPWVPGRKGRRQRRGPLNHV